MRRGGAWETVGGCGGWFKVPGANQSRTRRKFAIANAAARRTFLLVPDAGKRILRRMNRCLFLNVIAICASSFSLRAAEPTFAGGWETTYGHMEVKVEEKNASGTYQIPGGA